MGEKYHVSSCEHANETDKVEDAAEARLAEGRGERLGGEENRRVVLKRHA